MQLLFSNFTVCPASPAFIGYQYDNLTDVLQVLGTIPTGWSWVVMVQSGTNFNIIPLEQAEDGSLSVTLTAEMIPLTGYYTMQLRATQGDLVKYTNQFQAYVGASLSGDAQWPTIPTEFTEIEQNILDLNAHPSIPGQNGFWLVWDPVTKQYKESEYPLPDVSVGPAGKAATIEVAETVTGEPGSAADVVNIGDENAARLRFTIPRGQTGPVGATPQISVTVETLPAGSKATVEVTGTPEAPEIHLGIPQGAQGERGQQGIQGVQGWSVSAAALDEDGALVLTIRNPADGSTQMLLPVAIDNSAAIQEVVEAITDQGTTQVQRVETAGSTAVGEVSTAKDAALQAVDQAQTSATGAVSSTQTTAVQAVQAVQGTAETAIGAAQTAAVEAVEAKGTEEQEKLNAIVPSPTPEDAGKALVVNEDGTGLTYGDVPGGAGIDDDVIAKDSTWSSRMIVDSLAPAFSETGAVVTCNPVANYPLSIQAQIVPMQEGSGDPSPDNVRPISGWTESNLWASGGNLFNPDKLSGGQLTELDGVPVYQYTDGIVNFTFDVPIIRNQVFTLVFKLTGDSSNITSIIFHYSDGSASTVQILDGIGPITKTSDPKKTLVKITGNDAYNTVRYIDLTQTSLWIGNASKDYEPYRGRTVIIPFGQTIYGGELNWATGVLTITQAEIASYDGESLPSVWISDRDIYSPGATPTIGAQVVYELEEPQTIQLTPQEILALSGVNTIYADTGDVTVAGRADPNAVIKQLAARIAALESAAVANA